MAKTRELTIICEDVRITSTGYRVRVIVEDPKIDELITGISKDEIVEHIESEGYKPGEVFDDEALDKWATDNGYTKE